MKESRKFDRLSSRVEPGMTYPDYIFLVKLSLRNCFNLKESQKNPSL